ncbi:hypothetical protein ACYOEI_08045 [Singulisphaera rosea]
MMLVAGAAMILATVSLLESRKNLFTRKVRELDMAAWERAGAASPSRPRSESTQAQVWQNYYANLRAKYVFAKRYPWLPVTPDPPPPE